jgi:hypothetical protein
MNLQVERFWRRQKKSETKSLFARKNDLIIFSNESKPASNHRLMKIDRVFDEWSISNKF